MFPSEMQDDMTPNPAKTLDLETILLISNEDVDEVVHAVRDEADAIFTWDYQKSARPALGRLYEKAKVSQWDGETDLDWTTEVDPLRVLGGFDGRQMFAHLADIPGSPLSKFSQKDWDELTLESQNWRLSQFLHGEQGALLCTAKIVETVPWTDAKFYAATQVMDEARHVEVFAKYIDTKLTGRYPINAHLKALLDDIVTDSRWDVTYLGMQIIVEGLALAAFGLMAMACQEPLLESLLRRVMRDEARHVAFGVLTLQDLYRQLSDAELRERQEFALEAAVRMKGRFLQQEVWDRMGVDKKAVANLLGRASSGRSGFGSAAFARIVSNCRKLGLLDASDGWLRRRFEEIGIAKYEHWSDPEQDEAERAARG
jgi:hypothetical protein